MRMYDFIVTGWFNKGVQYAFVKKQKCQKCKKHQSIKTKYFITNEIIDNKICMKCLCGGGKFYRDERN